MSMLIDRLSGVSSVLLLQRVNSDKLDTIHDLPLDQSNDSELCLYYLQLIMCLMEYSPNNVWPALSATSASKGIFQSTHHLKFTSFSWRS